MKIAVIGAGTIGVTTAYELARDGHEVTVFERNGTAAEETSFAGAGLVAPGYITPWAAPGMPARMIPSIFSRHAPLRVRLPLSGCDLAWTWKSYRAGKPETGLANRAPLQRLAFYSRERLHHVTADLKLEYERNEGCLVLLRSERDSKKMQPGLQVLRDAEVAFRELNAVEARKVEPALNPETSFFGAIHLPDDEVGNCRQFTLILKNRAQQIGVKFSFNTTITQVQPADGVALSVAGDPTPHQYDAAVICTGRDSTRLLAPLGLKIPLAAVYGYSVSATVREPLNAPRSAVLDERYQVTVSRLGNRVRVAGGSELGGSPGKHRASTLQTLYEVLHDWFPGAANLSGGVQEWKGARPMLPDGLPILGTSGMAGLWLNLGHGASGWALSCGSARVLADQIGSRTPDLDVTRFGIGRLRA
jgi:D-amino-acid dehydrogenase